MFFTELLSYRHTGNGRSFEAKKGGLLLGSLLALPGGNAQRGRNVAGDVQAGTAHIEQTVHTVDDHDHIHGDTHSLQHHSQHDHTCAGDTGSTDGGQSGGDNDGDHLTQSQSHAAAGSQEDGGNALIDGGTVHVDGGTQGQNESSDLIIGTQLTSAILGNGQGCGGGGGGEGKDHGGESALEELHRAGLGKGLGSHGVHQNCVQSISNVSAQQNQEQRTQNLSALGSDDPGHHGEDTDGSQADDEAHQLLDDSVGRGDKVTAQLGLLTGSQHGAAQEQCDHDDLQHVGGAESFPHVGGEHTDQGIHEVGRGGAGPGGTVSQSQLGEQAGAVEDGAHRQADDAGDGGGDQEESNSLPADGADLLHVAHGQDTFDHGQQNHRNHDELQQVDEDGADGLQIVGGELGNADLVKEETNDDTQNQGDHDLLGQRQLLLEEVFVALHELVAHKNTSHKKIPACSSPMDLVKVRIANFTIFVNPRYGKLLKNREYCSVLSIF